ncbi:transposase [Parabacteroides sp. OttesenSCG-928-J18]|nr:transposase [Parabacteroides sp. OttesenSCG-928-J18]
MSQSLSQLYVHLVFHIKENKIYIQKGDVARVCSYIAGILQQQGCPPIQINGISDHIHILCVLSKNIALAKLIQNIKVASSIWIKTLGAHYRNFAWQKGYAAFSVSASVRDKTISYILRQEEHHQKVSFKDELLRFLQEYNIEYDERYLWVED